MVIQVLIAVGVFTLLLMAASYIHSKIPVHKVCEHLKLSNRLSETGEIECFCAECEQPV
jgi:hypothetical protein